MDLFEEFRAVRGRGKNTINLTDPQINTFNEKLGELMEGIHQELKLLIEDDLYQLILASRSSTEKLFSIIAQADILLAFWQFLCDISPYTDSCKPHLIQDSD